MESTSDSSSKYVDPEKMLKPMKEPSFKWISECDEKSFVYMGQTLSRSSFMGDDIEEEKTGKMTRSGGARKRRRRDGKSKSKSTAWSITNGSFTGGNLADHVYGLVRPDEAGSDVDVEPTVLPPTTTTTTTTTNQARNYNYTRNTNLDADAFHPNYERLASIDWESGATSGMALAAPTNITFDDGEPGTVHGGGGEVSIAHDACRQAGLPETVCSSGALVAGIGWPDAPCPAEYADELHTMLCHLIVCHDLGYHCMSFADELARYPHALWGSDAEMPHLMQIAHRNEQTAPTEGSLSYRVHFGDLQHWHAMAPSSDVTNLEVHAMVVKQAQGWLTEMQAATTPETRLMAFGKVVHLVQASYCDGHAARDAGGRITSFKTRPCWKEPRYAITPTDRVRALAVVKGMWGGYALIERNNTADGVQRVAQILREDVFILAAGAGQALVTDECAAPPIADPTADPMRDAVPRDPSTSTSSSSSTTTSQQPHGRTVGGRDRHRRDLVNDFYAKLCSGNKLPDCGAESAFVLGAQWPARPCSLSANPLAPVACAFDRPVLGKHHWHGMAEPMESAPIECEVSKATDIKVGVAASITSSNPYTLTSRTVQMHAPQLGGINRNDFIRSKIMSQMKEWYAAAVEGFGLATNPNEPSRKNAFWPIGKMAYTLRSTFLTQHTFRDGTGDVTGFGSTQCIEQDSLLKADLQDMNTNSKAHKQAAVVVGALVARGKALWEESKKDLTAWKLRSKQRLSDELQWLETFLLTKALPMATAAAGKSSGLYPGCAPAGVKTVKLPEPNQLETMGRFHCWYAVSTAPAAVKNNAILQHRKCDVAAGGRYISIKNSLRDVLAAYLWEENKEFKAVKDKSAATKHVYSLLAFHVEGVAAAAGAPILQDTPKAIAAITKALVAEAPSL